MRALLGRADLLAGGFLLTFASSLGQTWFIALSGPALRAELHLSHGAFGTVYALATLLGGFGLMGLGARIDLLAPRWMAIAIAVALGLSCMAMAFANGLFSLLVALFGLRLCGQGLMSHLAMTTVARGFVQTRGRALSVAALGYPAAEALLPAVVVVALDAYGWRQTWVMAGGIAILLLPPIFLMLLARTRASRPDQGEIGSAARGLRRRDLLLSFRFALLLPAMLTTGFVVTAIFFHQGALAAASGWPDGWFAVCIPAYAAASVVAALGSGFLVDRWGARHVLPVFLLPLAVAVLMLAVTSAPALGMVAMALAGLTAGSSNTVVTVALSELYGSSNLAVVRSLAVSAMIVASALSPALVGIALDLGATMTAALLACLVLILAAGPLAARGIARTSPASQGGSGP